jgi:hypothetical protein
LTLAATRQMLGEQGRELGAHMSVEGISRAVVVVRHEQLTDCLHIIRMTPKGQHVSRSEQGMDGRLLPATRQLAGKVAEVTAREEKEVRYGKWMT